jgi:hypothetical protein
MLALILFPYFSFWVLQGLILQDICTMISQDLWVQLLSLTW